MKNKRKLLLLLILVLNIVLVGCGYYIQADENKNITNNKSEIIIENDKMDASIEIAEEGTKENPREVQEIIGEDIPQEPSDDRFQGYSVIEVDGGNTSGHREASVAVNIGYGNREYWAFTNEYGQLVRVIADEIILQDDNNEPVNSDGRYYAKMANVPGIEDPNLDRGHVIADSLGGVANAYNITPQDSTLNRHGNQAYMEKVIRDAGGCNDFEAIINYPNTETQIPSKYKYTYTLLGNVIVDEFENVNPDEYNASTGITGSVNENNISETKFQSNDSIKGKYKGSIKSDKYHLPQYTHGGQIADYNLIWFDSIEDAERQGYKPCKNCFK